MKLIKLFSFLLIFWVVGCTQDQLASIDPSVLNSPVSSPAVAQVKLKELAWGNAHADWDKALRSALAEANIPKTVSSPCGKTELNECAAQLISIMSKYESGFKPEVKYEECSANKVSYSDGVFVKEKNKYCMMSNGEIVTSRGLLQISKDSANSSRYGCKIINSAELHDPIVNLKCAVKILAYQSVKSGTLMGDPKLGCAAYWSVCRQSSGSYAKISEYMKQF